MIVIKNLELSVELQEIHPVFFWGSSLVVYECDRLSRSFKLCKDKGWLLRDRALACLFYIPY